MRLPICFCTSLTKVSSCFRAVGHFSSSSDGGITTPQCFENDIICIESEPKPTIRAYTLFRALHMWHAQNTQGRNGSESIPPWLQALQRRRPKIDDLRGVLVAHMDMWLQPHYLEVSRLDVDRLWRLSYGLNRPTHSPPATSDFRIYGKRCLERSDLQNDTDWNWGHDSRRRGERLAVQMGQHSLAAERLVCAGWTDLYFLPRSTWGLFSDLVAMAVKLNVHFEVAIPTIFHAIEKHNPVQIMSCWGCSQAIARDPDVISSFACGHRADFEFRHVQHSFQAILDAQPGNRSFPKALQRVRSALDNKQDAWDGKERWWETQQVNRWSAGCCELPSEQQTGRSCRQLNPPEFTRKDTVDECSPTGGGHGWSQVECIDMRVTSIAGAG